MDLAKIRWSGISHYDKADVLSEGSVGAGWRFRTLSSTQCGFGEWGWQVVSDDDNPTGDNGFECLPKVDNFTYFWQAFKIFLLSLQTFNPIFNMLIGRKDAVNKLMKAYGSKEPEFVAVYGRRRVGKTYLIKETFGTKFTFQYTGIHNVPNSVQLGEFHNVLIQQGFDMSARKPKTWFNAFHLLECW